MDVGIRYPGTEDTDDCEPTCRFWKPKQCALQEKWVLFPAETLLWFLRFDFQGRFLFQSLSCSKIGSGRTLQSSFSEANIIIILKLGRESQLKSSYLYKYTGSIFSKILGNWNFLSILCILRWPYITTKHVSYPKGKTVQYVLISINRYYQWYVNQ